MFTRYFFLCLAAVLLNLLIAFANAVPVDPVQARSFTSDANPSLWGRNSQLPDDIEGASPHSPCRRWALQGEKRTPFQLANCPFDKDFDPTNPSKVDNDSD